MKEGSDLNQGNGSEDGEKRKDLKDNTQVKPTDLGVV